MIRQSSMSVSFCCVILRPCPVDAKKLQLRKTLWTTRRKYAL